MALEYGFYDSMNGDRRYNAEQMSGIFEGLVNDGVYESVGDKFFVTPGSGLQVIVGTGRAWFHRTWNKNKAALPLSIDRADPAFARIDSVCLEVNAEDSTRANRIMIMKGNVALNPEPPIFPSTDKRVYWLRLANVRVRANTTSILASDINIRVGSSECPFVTSIVQQTNIDQLFAGWDLEFNTWWDSIKVLLNDNVATNLQNQITNINGSITTINNQLSTFVKISDKASKAEVEAGTNNSKWVTPATLKSGVGTWSAPDKMEIGRIIMGFDFPIDKFLKCDGSFIKYSEYPELFDLIGYGASENSVEITATMLTTLSKSLTNPNTMYWATNTHKHATHAGCLLCGYSVNVHYFMAGANATSNWSQYYGMIYECGLGYSNGYDLLIKSDAFTDDPPSTTSITNAGRVTTYQKAGDYTSRPRFYYASQTLITAGSSAIAGYFVDDSNKVYHIVFPTSGTTRTIALYVDKTLGIQLGTWKNTKPIFIFATAFWENTSGELESFKVQTAGNLFPTTPTISMTDYKLIANNCTRFRHSRDFKCVLAIGDNVLYKLTLDSNSNVVLKSLTIKARKKFTEYAYLYSDEAGKVIMVDVEFASRVGKTKMYLGIEHDDGTFLLSDNVFKPWVENGTAFDEEALVPNDFRDDAVFAPFSTSMIYGNTVGFAMDTLGTLSAGSAENPIAKFEIYSMGGFAPLLLGGNVALPTISQYAYIKALN